jgi:hypothetical protein
MAISIVKKPSVPANGGSSKPPILKNTLKKSMSVPNAILTVQKLVPATSVAFQAVVKKFDGLKMGQRQLEYAEQAQKRKEQLVKRVNEEKEKELKVKFHANPAPKFRKVSIATKQVSVENKKIIKQNSMPQLLTLAKNFTSKENIVPACGDPERLKFMEEKKRKTLAKYQEPVVQFKAKPAAVLKKQPFQPVHNIPKVIDPKPFKLHLADRLLMRSEFDKKLHETIAIRKKQDEIRKQLADFEDRRLIRQKTVFRAQPIQGRNNIVRNNH